MLTRVLFAVVNLLVLTFSVCQINTTYTCLCDVVTLVDNLYCDNNALFTRAEFEQCSDQSDKHAGMVPGRADRNTRNSTLERK